MVYLFSTPIEVFEMPKKVLIALPPAMLEQVDFIAMHEHRTRSDLIREALRRYMSNFKNGQGNQHETGVIPIQYGQNNNPSLFVGGAVTS